MGTSSGRSVFFFRNAKKAWEKYEKMFGLMIHTPRKINIEPENDGLEDDFPFPGVYSQVPAVNLPGCKRQIHSGKPEKFLGMF